MAKKKKKNKWGLVTGKKGKQIKTKTNNKTKNNNWGLVAEKTETEQNWGLVAEKTNEQKQWGWRKKHGV